MKVLPKKIDVGLVEGVAPHPKDAAVVKALAAANRKLGGSGPSIIGFKNEDGVIYRYGTITGMAQEMYLSDKLEDLGFEDESIDDRKMPKGVWNTFVPVKR
ncbi:hypothetical protein [Polaromonas aquatica]|uniref:hypothetical protein n=1 Tax=Polaromonas aquatica TaxID=332657 RepID=UPI003D6608D3